MKKLLTVLLTALMIITVGVASVSAEPATGWIPNGGEVLSGKGGSYIITGGESLGGGAFNKDHVSDLLVDGIDEEVNVFVDVDGMKNKDLFEISVGVKTASDVYKTEQVITLQKDGDAVIVNNKAETLSLTESQIYNFKWNITKGDDNYIYAKITVSDLNGNVIGTLQSDKLMNTESGLAAQYEPGDHLGYLWVFNVQTTNGVHIYENTDCIDKYSKSDWTLDGATVEGTDDSYTIKGGEVFNYTNISKQLINSTDVVYNGHYGIEEKLNFFINLEEMAVNELFEASVGIKDIKDVYKTEQVVTIQKIDTNKVRFDAKDGQIFDAVGSGIYTLDWKFFKTGANNIKCIVEILKNGTKIGELGHNNIGPAVSGDHLGYVWIFNNQTSNGIHIYSELPEKPSVAFADMEDSYRVGEEAEITVNVVNNGPRTTVKSNSLITEGKDCIKVYWKNNSGEWVEFSTEEGTFGPVQEFPLFTMSYSFKLVFIKDGTVTFNLNIVDPKTGDELLCKAEKTITVEKQLVPATPELYKGAKEYVANLGSDAEMFIENLEDYEDMEDYSFQIKTKGSMGDAKELVLDGNKFNLKPGTYEIKVVSNDPIYTDSEPVEVTVKASEYAFTAGIAKVPYGSKEYEVVCDYDYDKKYDYRSHQIVDNLRCMTIDGVEVNPEFYTLEKGSTIFTYKPAKPMKYGIYKVGFHYENGLHLEGTLVVYPEVKPTPAPTPTPVTPATPYVAPKTGVK